MNYSPQQHQVPQEDQVPRERCLPPSRRNRLRSVALMTAGALAAGIAIAACGGGASTPGVAAAPATTATTTANTVSPAAGRTKQATGLLAYASCMRSHGVPSFPDPAGSGGIPKQAVISALSQVGNSRFDAASNACAGLLPAGGSLSGQAAEAVPTRDQQDYLKAAACMRSHGITNFPDPIFSGGNVSFPIPSSINSNSTQFTAARQTCEKLIPAGLPDSGSRG